MSQKRSSSDEVTVETPKRSYSLLSSISRAKQKNQPDTYQESGNRFLSNKSIVRGRGPTISDQKDSIVFEWIDVDL